MDDTLRWLLAQDPALRWRVERDLVDVAPEVWTATRSRVAVEGMGARLLAVQDPQGTWAGGAYFPAHFDADHPGPGQPWTATTHSLTSLREWGVDAAVLAGTADKLENARWEYDDLPYWDGEVDVCINGYTLANGSWLGRDMSTLRRWFAEHTMAEGGWNCEWVEGSTRASVTSTLNALRGILDDEKRTGDRTLVPVRHEAEAYLLRRRVLYRKSADGDVTDTVRRLAYPFRHFYSALHALVYFREAALHDAVAPDERLADAIEEVRSQRSVDGRWRQARRHPGEVWFQVDVDAGEYSPWLTYYARLVLEWWDSRDSLAR